MKIISLNRGSSSIKCALYDLPGSEIPLRKKDLELTELSKEMFPDVLIDCIGHRIVHGGLKYRESVFIDEGVKNEIKKLGNLAPLHISAIMQNIFLLKY